MTKFTNTDNQTNPADSLSANTLKVYNRNLLERAVEEFVISKFTDKKTQPKYNGKTAVFSVYDQIPATAFTAAVLADGVTPVAVDLTKKSVSADIANYGAFIELTDEVSLYHEDGAGLIVEATDNLGSGAGTAIESLLFAEAEANAGIDFLTTPEVDTETGLDKAETQLRVNLAKKFKKMITGSKNTDTVTIRDCYVAFVNPTDILAVEAMTSFVTVDKYGYSDGLIMNEVGSRRGLRFVESNNAAAGQITILGEGALGEVSVRSSKMKTIVQGLGEGNDPIEQRQTVAVKFAIAPKMLRPEWSAICAIV